MSRTFRDEMEREWAPKLTTPVLIDALRELNVTIAGLIDQSVNAGAVIELIWYCCRDQAVDRKITKKDFFNDLPPSRLPAAVSALFVVVADSFPNARDVLGGVLAEMGLPFGLGELVTSMSSPSQPEQASETT